MIMRKSPSEQTTSEVLGSPVYHNSFFRTSVLAQIVILFQINIEKEKIEGRKTILTNAIHPTTLEDGGILATIC
jgi:hypothetical protein